MFSCAMCTCPETDRCIYADCRESQRCHLIYSKPHIFLCVSCRKEFLSFVKLTNNCCQANICYECYLKTDCSPNCLCHIDSYDICPYYPEYVFSQIEIERLNLCKNFRRHPAFKHTQAYCSCYTKDAYRNVIAKEMRDLQKRMNKIVEELIRTRYVKISLFTRC